MMKMYQGLTAICSSTLLFGLTVFAADGIAVEGWLAWYCAALALGSCVGLCGMWKVLGRSRG